MGSLDRSGIAEIKLRGETVKLKLVCDDCYVGDRGQLVVEKWRTPDQRIVVAVRTFAAGYWEFVGWSDE